MSTPFSLGKVVVATAGTPVQLGVTSLNGAITAAAASLAVASFNGIPPIGTLFQIDSEQVLLTGLSGGNLTWAIQRGVNGTTAAAHLTGAAVTALMPVSRLFASTVAGLTGKCYLGCAGLNKATMAGVIKEFWPTGSGGGVDDTFSLPVVERERYNLTDFWIDVAVSGEALTISGTVAPL
jgi:hypothetical protein